MAEKKAQKLQEMDENIKVCTCRCMYTHLNAACIRIFRHIPRALAKITGGRRGPKHNAPTLTQTQTLNPNLQP
jgi:hypothetical protein